MLKKVDVKLRDDAQYLNIHYVEYNPSENPDPEFKSIPRPEGRKPFTFEEREGVYYNIVFLKDGIGVDSVYLLYLMRVEQAGAAGGGLFTEGEATDDSSRPLKFNDMWFLKTQHRALYDKFLDIIHKKTIEIEDNDGEVATLLAINPDNQIKTSLGMSSRDNTDYLNYQRINSPHWFMSAKKKTGGGRGRGGGGAASPFRIDASFSRIGFSHEVMNFKAGVAGIELTTESPLLNLLPFQAGTFAGGFRVLFALANDPDINKSTFLDAKFLARIKLGDMISSIPMAMTDSSALNVGTGIMGNISITRPFGLPFYNLYFAFGNPDYTDPTYIIERNNQRYAYWSFNQAELSVSFFWNESDLMVGRFKLDVGAGYYSVIQAFYNNNNVKTGTKSALSTFYPVIGLSYNFVPRNNPLLGGSIKIFDSQVKFKSWFKVAEFGDNQTIRVEAQYQSAGLARKARDWETDGGLFFNIRYRYGL